MVDADRSVDHDHSGFSPMTAEKKSSIPHSMELYMPQRASR